jgi:hypothetical protein
MSDLTITSGRVKLISDLPLSTPLDGSELTAIVQQSITKQTQVLDIGKYTKSLDYATWVYGNSANFLIMESLSSNWNSVYSSSLATSGNWNSVYSSVKATSANWDNVYSSVLTTSSNWNNAYSALTSTSGNWNSAYNQLSLSASNWNQTYNNSPNFLLKNVNTGKQIIFGDVTIFGSLSTSGTTNLNNVNLTQTSAINCINTVPSITALTINQVKNSVSIADFYDNGNSVFHVGRATDNSGNLTATGVIGIKTSTPNATLTINGNVSANSDIYTSSKFYGDGSNITNINGANIQFQTIPTNRLVGTLDAGALIGPNSIYATQLATNAAISGTQLSPTAGILPTQLSTGAPNWNINGNTTISGILSSGSNGGNSFNNLLIQGDGTNAYIRPTNANSSLYLGSNNTNKVIINSSGYLGIGGSLSPAYPIDISSGSLRITNGEFISSATNNARFIAGNYGIIHRNDGTNYYILLTNSGDQYGSYNALRPFAINLTSGAVTLSNSAIINNGLTVNQSSTINGGLTVNGGQTINTGGITVSSGGASISGGATISGGLTLDTINLTSNQTVAGTLGVSGSITTPLNVAIGGSVLLNNGGCILSKDSSGTYRTLLEMYSDNTVNLFNAGNNSVRVLNQAGNAVLVTLSDSSGNLTATGDVTAYSDERLKKEIKTIDNALEKVNQLRGVSYERIDSGKKQIGVIAQEVEKVIPEVVLDGEDYKSVSYGNIVGLLIEAIKDLNKEVESLKEQLNAKS